jgi:hypothetical protein
LPLFLDYDKTGLYFYIDHDLKELPTEETEKYHFSSVANKYVADIKEVAQILGLHFSTVKVL